MGTTGLIIGYHNPLGCGIFYLTCFFERFYVLFQKKTMRSKFISLCFILFLGTTLFAQEKPIELEEEKKANRLFLYAVNKNLVDYDILLTVKGTGFRQRNGKPRPYRVPATSRVQVMSLVVERGKQAVYTYDIVANDSLSRRAVVKPAELIKIETPEKLTIYLPEACETCDDIMTKFEASPYIYTVHTLSEKPLIKEQLSKAFVGSSTPIDEIKNPIFSFTGKIFINIDTYEGIFEKMKEGSE
jgi:hypothetical protein